MRSIRDLLYNEFRRLNERWVNTLEVFPNERLFAEMPSFGETLIRSVAEIEMIAGGITTRLWDDPFEWTLPEELSNKAAIAAYIEVVIRTQEQCFAMFDNDNDLLRVIPAPIEPRSLFSILLDGLIKSQKNLAIAEHLLGKIVSR